MKKLFIALLVMLTFTAAIAPEVNAECKRPPRGRAHGC
jgi:hypothetical protein